MSKRSSRARLGDRRIAKPVLLDAFIAAHQKALGLEQEVPKRFSRVEAFQGAVGQSVHDASRLQEILATLQQLRQSSPAAGGDVPGSVVVTEDRWFGRRVYLVLAQSSDVSVTVPNTSGGVMVCSPEQFRGRRAGDSWIESYGRPGEQEPVVVRIVDLY